MMRKTLQWVLQKIMMMIKKKFLAGEEYLVNDLLNKASKK